MLTLYLQTCCTRTDADDLSWIHPFLAQIFAVYCRGDSLRRPVIFAHVPSLNAWRAAHADQAWSPPVEAEVRPFSSERELLENFWAMLGSGPSETLVSYNGRKHLIPFLYHHSAGARVKITKPDLIRERYRMGPHIDLAYALTFLGQSEKASLLQVAQAWQLPVPKLKEGPDLQALFRHAFEAGEPAIWSILMNNGLEYLNTTELVRQRWKDFLKETIAF